MKTSILFLLLLLSPIAGKTQQFGYKYWEMRQRFLDKFIRVGEGHGMSIPDRWVTKNIDGIDILKYEDESPRHIGWYIAVLATEHRLLTLQERSTCNGGQAIYH